MKAIILGQQRCGSTLLCNALNNHPDLTASEIEPLHTRRGWGEVEKMFEEFDIVKIMYNQITLDVLYEILTSDYKLVNLVRDSLFNQSLSYLIAREIKQWSTKGKVDTTKVTIREKDLKKRMEVFVRERKMVFPLLENRITYFDLRYTDLVGEEGKSVKYLSGKKIDGLCRFLEVEPRKLKVDLKKQNPDLSQRVINYEKLKNSLW